MIGRIRGTLIVKNPPHLMVEVGGVGYELEAPMSTFYQLPEQGGDIMLFTHLQVREDAHTLFGFVSDGERTLFRSLLKINGVGAKMALTILSGIEADAFRRCIQEGDTAALVRLPGVGRKTAERLVVEMRDRFQGESAIPAPGADPAAAGARAADPSDEAVQALVALGYRPPEAQRMVDRVRAEGRSSQDLIRHALKASLS